MSKKIVLALGGNALGDDLAGQMKAVKITSQAIVDLIAQGHEVIVTHGNGPQVGMINQAFEAAASFARSRAGREALITVLSKAKEGIEGKTGTVICQ